MERNVQWLSVGAAVRVAGFTMVSTFFFLYLRNVFHVGYVEIGLLVTLTGVFPLAVVPIGGFLADRLGRRPLLLSALLGEGLTLFAIARTIQIGWLLGLVIFVTVLQTVGAVGGRPCRRTSPTSSSAPNGRWGTPGCGSPRTWGSRWVCSREVP